MTKVNFVFFYILLTTHNIYHCWVDKHILVFNIVIYRISCTGFKLFMVKRKGENLNPSLMQRIIPPFFLPTLSYTLSPSLSSLPQSLAFRCKISRHMERRSFSGPPKDSDCMTNHVQHRRPQPLQCTSRQQLH